MENTLKNQIGLQQDSRIEWLDIAKGIGIILVIIGHIFADATMLPLRKFIYSFHMPLFFFLSGFLFSTKDIKIKDFLFKRVKTILIPYFIFALISFLLYVSAYLFIKKISPGSVVGQDQDILKLFYGIFYSKAAPGYMSYNVPIWFLTCIFLVQVIYFILNRIIKNEFIILGITFILSILSFSFFRNIFLPWSIDAAFIGIFFFSVGFILKKYKIFEKIPDNKLLLLFISLFLLFITVLISQFNNEVVLMAENKYGNYLLFLLGSFIGTFFIILISLVIRKSIALSFMGKNSMTILGFHMLFIYNFKSVIKVFSGYTYDHINSSILINLIVLLVTVCLSVISVIVWNKLYRLK